MASVQARVASTPALTAEFTAFTRDYDTIQRSYTDLLSKYEDAKAAAALEAAQVGEQFKVLDRPRLPNRPSARTADDQPGGALAGLAIGLGLVALMEYKNKGLRSEDDVMSVLRLPVLAVIPAIETRLDRRRRKRRRILSLASTAVVVVLMAGPRCSPGRPGASICPCGSGNRMYEKFYGLAERPFDLTPNPRFIYLSECHLEALSVVHYGIVGRKGITLVVGEAGTGKTTVIRTALRAIAQPTARCVYLSNPR